MIIGSCSMFGSKPSRVTEVDGGSGSLPGHPSTGGQGMGGLRRSGSNRASTETVRAREGLLATWSSQRGMSGL